MKIEENSWSQFVDLASIIWLGVFALGFIVNARLEKICFYVNIALLWVFFLDLIFIFKKHEKKRNFFKNHWFDILMIIPYFRIFRMARFTRFFKTVKIMKKIRFVQKFKRIKKLKIFIRLKKVKFFKKLFIAHETVDLGRTIKQRSK